MIKTSQWLEALMAVVGSAVLLLFALWLLAFLVQYARVSMNLGTASGVVQEKSALEDRGEGLMDRFTLRYSFTAANGHDYTGTADVGKSFYERVALGDRLTIEYAADDPGNSRVRGEVSPAMLMILFLAAVSLGLFGFAGVRGHLRSNRVTRRSRDADGDGGT